MNNYKAGLIGCGDLLRWLIDGMNASQRIKVKSTFDLDRKKSELRASQLNAKAVDSIDDIFNDKEISVVYIFTPPWVRLPLFEKAVKNKKHIITTKPLAPNAADAKKLYNLVKGKVTCSVHYGRTGNASVEMMKKIFDSGEIGKLAIYKEDWFHHYPTWNNWATDPKKNGGPFMDAMVHNLNKARYLMGRKLKSASFFSDNYAQKLKCNDTESMKLNFAGNGCARLFITWAADLEIFDPTGNDREHIGISHFITDKGWYVKETNKDGVPYIHAHKDKQVKEWKVEPLANTAYDQFIIDLEAKRKPEPDIKMAMEDIELMDEAMKKKGKEFLVKF
jgi:predicted dehydrogenase